MHDIDSPLLTIAIISHKQIHLVERLLKSLQDYPPKENFRVVVLENVKNQPDLRLNHTDFQIIYLKNDVSKSLSANVNHLFESYGKRSEYFCILNPDIVFEEEVFTDLIKAMNTHKIDVVSPIIVDDKGFIQDTFRSIPNPREIFLRYFNMNKLSYDHNTLPLISYPDWIAGMFMLMSSKVFEKIGRFNLRYYLYFEDVDFCIRALNNGYRIGVYKNVQVVHEAQRTSHRNFLFLWKHIISAIKFFSSEEYHTFKKTFV